MGPFVNDFVADARMLWALAAVGALILGLFSILYNRWMDDLGEKKQGYTALLVALGNGVTLLVVAVFSWKAAVLGLLAFTVSGAAMIVGDLRRADRQREQAKRPRRKALPYAAAGLVDEAMALLADVQRGMKKWLEGKSDVNQVGLMALAVKDAASKLAEARRVEGE